MITKHVTQDNREGMIEREERRHTPYGSQTNKYGFKGLIAKATPFAKEKIAEIEERQKAKAPSRRPAEYIACGSARYVWRGHIPCRMISGGKAYLIL